MWPYLCLAQLVYNCIGRVFVVLQPCMALQVISLSFLCVWNPSHGCFPLFTRTGVFSSRISPFHIHIYGTTFSSICIWYDIIPHQPLWTAWIPNPPHLPPLLALSPVGAELGMRLLPSVIIISNLVNIQYSAMYGVQWWAVIRIMLHMFRWTGVYIHVTGLCYTCNTCQASLGWHPWI